MGKTKTKKLTPLQHSLETIQDYASDGAKNVVKGTAKGTADIIGQSTDDFLSMLGMGGSSESSHENKDPRRGEVELFNAEKKRNPEARAHIEYHDQMRKLGEHTNRAENHQITQTVQELLMEMQRLIKSSKAVETEFAEFAVMESPKEVGRYDMNFFEWMLLVIKQAREKVEDSGAWLATVKGKNGKKGGGYWGMFKKHGTSFGMSSERSTATSVG